MHVCACDTINYSLPGSSTHGVLQAKILEWVAIPPSGDLRNPEIKHESPALKADSLPSDLLSYLPTNHGFNFLNALTHSA